MKDLDFDELDKAVNALTAHNQTPPKPQPIPAPRPDAKAGPQPVQAPEPKPESDSPATKPEPLHMSEPLPITVPPAAAKPAVAPTVTPSRRGARLGAKPASAPIAPLRKSGAAMDIVAPKPPARVSRTSATLKPPLHITPKELPADEQPAPKPRETLRPKPEPKTIHSPEPIHPTTTPQPTVKAEDFMRDDGEHWPDPLDFFKPDSDDHKDESAAKPAAEKPPERPSSPFIEGAKVEKRPLGAFTPSPKPTATDTVHEHEDTPDASHQPIPTEAHKADTAAPDNDDLKPVELQIEPKPTASAAKPVDEDHLLPDHIAEEPKADTHKSLEQTVRDNATLSIPQQYKTAPKTLDKSVHPVFDTKDYHPPLMEDTAHAKRHKTRAWLKWLITFIVLVALGVALYVGFSYMLQQSNL